MGKENLAIVSNEKTYINNQNYFCDNIDMKSIPEGLNKNFDIELFVRDSKSERSSHKIDLKNIIVSKNIISYILNIFKKKSLHNKYLVISLSPYTFIICLLLFFLRKKIFVYLRSDGYEEYKCYSKYFGPIIYHIMFKIASWVSTFIACRSHILYGKKGELVSPSQLNDKWFINRKSPDLKIAKLLYVGRIRIEKGIFSLIDILKEIKLNFNFTIFNPEKKYNDKLKVKNTKIIHFNKQHESMIENYDEYNIFILPSFTESHPQVLDESLSRLRPVIVFPEISHVTRNREGVFISERNSISLSKKIQFILENYESIQKKMINNKLPTKEDFLNQLSTILSK